MKKLGAQVNHRTPVETVENAVATVAQKKVLAPVRTHKWYVKRRAELLRQAQEYLKRRVKQ